MNDKEFKWLNTRLKARTRRIELIRLAIESEQENNWQKNRTPIEIVDRMVSKTNVMNKTILVLFNLEFLEVLIYKYHIPPKNIFFFADHELEQIYAEKFYGVKTVLGNSELMKEQNKGDLHPLVKRILEMGQKKFDLVFSNPPYNSNMDLKILSAVEPLCKEMVVVHPSTWLLDLKGLAKRYNDFKVKIKDKLKSVEFFNGNPVFNIGLFVPCVITHIDNTHNDSINVNYFDTEYEVNNIKDITKFGKEWETIVKLFMVRIKTYILENSDVWQHNKSEIDPKKFHCQLAAIRGNVNCTGIDSGIISDDFYTLVMKDLERNKGIRQTGMPTFEFITENKRNNFVGYCKTDFVRFCLTILKNSQNCHRGEMRLIPWLDFTQEWDDKKLYKFFEINEETQKYIEDFLPDYYGIRTKIEEKK